MLIFKKLKTGAYISRSDLAGGMQEGICSAGLAEAGRQTAKAAYPFPARERSRGKKRRQIDVKIKKDKLVKLMSEVNKCDELGGP